ncbi:alpha/beta hydrolase family protein [Magnetococcales bacterium HHB-1]
MRRFGFVLLFLLIAGCANLLAVFNRQKFAEWIAEKGPLQHTTVVTKPFLITSFYRVSDPGADLWLYIEGDGFAWKDRWTLSRDPTPRNPVALRLAATDRRRNVVYLARPCQYSGVGGGCYAAYWSNRRFSETVIASMNQAVDYFKKESQTERIHLVGFSGGAAVAVLIAARRGDVVSLQSVAGNLDHVTLHQHHNVNQIPESLNPIDVADKVKHIPQYHWRSVDDRIIPVQVTARFMRKVGGKCAKVHTVSDIDHDGDWHKQWFQWQSHLTLACRS